MIPCTPSLSNSLEGQQWVLSSNPLIALKEEKVNSEKAVFLKYYFIVIGGNGPQSGRIVVVDG
jgi:hypothetical protein